MTDSAHTFLFADLVGFTALAESEGDGRAADVAETLFARARDLIETHGGEEVKTLGDGVMLRAADAEAGIRVALGLVDSAAETPDLPPVRVGVHTGTAVSRGNDWFGRGVNVAARLCTAAGGDEVLVSESALDAAGELDDLDLGKRRLHWLKNITEPIPARVVFGVAERPRPSSSWQRRLVPSRPASVGLTAGSF